jgi:hypothetical protein
MMACSSLSPCYNGFDATGWNEDGTRWGFTSCSWTWNGCTFYSYHSEADEDDTLYELQLVLSWSAPRNCWVGFIMIVLRGSSHELCDWWIGGPDPVFWNNNIPASAITNVVGQLTGTFTLQGYDRSPAARATGAGIPLETPGVCAQTATSDPGWSCP